MKPSIRFETRTQFRHDHITLADVNDVIAYLNSDPKPETVNQLFDFGKLLLDQIRSLRSSYDSKLTACLGWGVGSLAVLLVGTDAWIGSAGFASVATVSAFLGALIALLGLKSWGGWKWPNQKEWFNPDYLDWPDRLKNRHLLAMLESHRSYSERAQKKGVALMLAEYCLGVSGLCLVAAIVMRKLAA